MRVSLRLHNWCSVMFIEQIKPDWHADCSSSDTAPFAHSTEVLCFFSSGPLAGSMSCRNLVRDSITGVAYADIKLYDIKSKKLPSYWF
jgi:hypothetical protein